MRLMQEIIDCMKEIRAIFISLLRMGCTGRGRVFRPLIIEKNRNIQVMEQIYERVTGMRPLNREPCRRLFIRSFCHGLRRAFLEQSAVIDRIGRLNRLLSRSALRREISAVGNSELRSLSEINRLYLQCR